ncbi:MAG: hypothetical protein LLF86_04170, partial [Nitrospiraceae bacterium]|nr:hypothetical protein [Nitrospiraceae bacterium]
DTMALVLRIKTFFARLHPDYKYYDCLTYPDQTHFKTSQIPANRTFEAKNHIKQQGQFSQKIPDK